MCLVFWCLWFAVSMHVYMCACIPFNCIDFDSMCTTYTETRTPVYPKFLRSIIHQGKSGRKEMFSTQNAFFDIWFLAKDDMSVLLDVGNKLLDY